MKRILALILTVIMVFGCASLASAEETDVSGKVEISFKVGDSTLMINGNAVEVETPYVVGAGTTLVPLRVITEAFGAKVTWVNETKEIILEYPDVNITLQIGNINATVNTHTETLPEAPVLSPNGVTMVPLRFISETFGATVGYDNETAAITVVKEAGGENSTISSSTSLPRIGDSYWNWSMLTPASMMMTDRYLDGIHTLFEDEGSATLSVNIYDVSDYEDFTFDSSYKTMKDSMRSTYTLSKDEKGKDSTGSDSFRLVGRNKERYMDLYVVYSGDVYYRVCFTCDAGDEAIGTLTPIVESFKAEFAKDESEKKETHDLSNVDDDGYRIIEDEELKFSFKVPATLTDAQSQKMNIFRLVSDKENDCTEIVLGIYSKSETITAESLAKEDKKFHDDYSNPDFCKVSDIYKYKVNPVGDNACGYDVMTNGLTDGDYDMYDIFFEKGDYVYNMTITVPTEKREIFNHVMSTFKAEELDGEKVGTLLRTPKEWEPYTISTDDWSMELDTSWTKLAQASDEETVVYANNYTGSLLSVSMVDVDGSVGSDELRRMAQNFCETQAKNGKVIKPFNEGSTTSRGYYTFTIKVDAEKTSNQTMYYSAYFLKMKTKVVLIQLYEMEEYANSKTKQDMLNYIESFKIK